MCFQPGYYYYFLKPTSTKPQAEILTLNKVNGCNDVSFGDHSVLEGDRIPPLKSHGQSLEEELCFPGVLSDNRDAPANPLRHFYGCLMPRTCCFYGKRTEDMGAGQLGVLVRLLLLLLFAKYRQLLEDFIPRPLIGSPPLEPAGEHPPSTPLGKPPLQNIDSAV